MNFRRPKKRQTTIRLAATSVLASLVATGIISPAPFGKPRVEGQAIRLTEPTVRANAGWRQVIKPTSPTNMVGFEWEGESEGELQTRALKSGVWTEWVEAGGQPDEGPDSGSPEGKGGTFTGPVWFGFGVEEVEVRVERGSLRGLKMHSIRSDPRPATRGISSASATPAWPGIYFRNQWGADESWRSCTTTVADKINLGVVHHTATSNDYAGHDVGPILQAIYHYHVFSRGFCDIGYNFLIDKYGRIFEGRAGGVTEAVQGAHAQGFNYGSFGASVIGNHEIAGVEPAAYAALRTLFAWKFAHHGVDAGAQVTVTSGGSNKWPAGTVLGFSTIIGHRDVSQTACPGDHLYPFLANLRRDVQWEVMSTPPFPLGGWQPVSTQPRLLVLSSWGGLHPAGREGAVFHTGFWHGWPIIRGGVRLPTGGYIIDGWGGFHSFGGGPTPSAGPYWQGWDIVRGLAGRPTTASGWVLDGWGGIHPFGGAPAMQSHGYWPGWDIARGLVVNSAGTGGYVMDAFGGIHRAGISPAVNDGPYWQGWDIARGFALRADGKSGYVVDAFGGVHPFGGAPKLNVSRYTPGADSARGIVLNAQGNGGWTVDADGYLWPFGNAGFVKTSMTWTGLGITRGIILGAN
jgi:hypothetical protein